MNLFTLLLDQTPLLISGLLGAAIGLEREIRGKDPSLRTFSFICMGSCMFCMVSQLSVAGVHAGDPSRIASQIVPGIGFLGVGTIVRSTRGVRGLTTAALMWVTAGIGMAVGFKQYELGVVATLYALIISMAFNVIHDVIRPIRAKREEVIPHDGDGK